MKILNKLKENQEEMDKNNIKNKKRFKSSKKNFEIMMRENIRFYKSVYKIKKIKKI